MIERFEDLRYLVEMMSREDVRSILLDFKTPHTQLGYIIKNRGDGEFKRKLINKMYQLGVLFGDDKGSYKLYTLNEYMFSLVVNFMADNLPVTNLIKQFYFITYSEKMYEVINLIYQNGGTYTTEANEELNYPITSIVKVFNSEMNDGFVTSEFRKCKRIFRLSHSFELFYERAMDLIDDIKKVKK